MTTDIAIIGASALFPGARDMRTYWQNILNKVSAIEDASEEWIGPYYDPSSEENDRLYTRKGGFLGDLAEFNPAEFGIMPNSVDGGDPDHFLALKLAKEALRDAGYVKRPFNGKTTGIILGRGTYFNRGFGTVVQHGAIVDQTLELLSQLHPQLDKDTLFALRKELKASLPPFTAEMSPGLVPNVVTGRIANRLDLMGPNYIIDAACASSLIAVELAIKELLQGRCDMMLAGGVQASTPPQVHMVFCQIGALSRSDIRPFSESADGTLLSEGVGILVLKRLKDAERDGDRIYAVIKGVGVSSDGKALGLLAPRWEGEVLALQRAYDACGIDPRTVGLVEAHGTGIPLGDRTEVQSLTKVFGDRVSGMPSCALGSVKSMLGHCIPAAGSASIIKMALSLYHKILPPTLCDRVNPALEIEKTPFYINNETRPWIHGSQVAPRRAGVNAFGFGGINAHLVLEEYTGKQPQEEKLLHYQWPTELLIFSAQGREALLSLVENVRDICNSNTSLANLAYTLSTQTGGSDRLAIIAKDIADLQNKLDQVIEKLKDRSRTRLQTRNGIYYESQPSAVAQGKTAFLFPGEGSQYPNMLADVSLHFPKVREWFDFLDETFAEIREHSPSRFIFPPPTGLTEEESSNAVRKLFTMDTASETVFIASMALYELLCDLGISCDMMLGHSTGENTALTASGTIRLASREQLRQSMRYLNEIYRELEKADNIPKGALLTVGGADSELIKQLLDEFYGHLHLAMDNCRNQVVLFGSESDIEAVTVRLKAAGAIYARLPFDRAYHTPLFAEVEAAFRNFYNALDMGVGKTLLYSCAFAEAFPTEPDEIRAMAAKQWSTRVLFRETIEKLYSEGVRTFIEVGPSSNLTAFVDDILKGREYLALSSNDKRKPGLEQIQHLLGRLFVNGMAVNLSHLYRYRELSAINLDPASLISDLSSKPSPILKLTMPIIQLKSEFVDSIRDKFAPKALRGEQENVVSEEAYQEEKIVRGNKEEKYIHPLIPFRETLPEEAQSPSPVQEFGETPVLTKPEADFQTIPYPDTRLSILTSHFELMQEFLANQERVTASVYANLGLSGQVQNYALLPSPTAISADCAQAWPLLGEIIEIDSQSLHSVRYFNLEQDLFLHDHALGSQVSQRRLELSPLAVIPFTISMEILAQAAAYLLGGDKVVVGFSDVRGYRWLALDRGELTLDIYATLENQIDENTWMVKGQLCQADPTKDGISQLVFECQIALGTQFPPSQQPIAFHLDRPSPSRWLDTDLYTKGMFHGPRFQGVKHIRQWSQQGIEADVEILSVDNFFRDIHKTVFKIDAGLLDAATQISAFWVSEQVGTDFHVFPFHIQSFHQYTSPLTPGSLVCCRGLIRYIDDKRTTESDFDFIDENGQLIARIEGLHSLYFSVPHRYYQCRLKPQHTYFSDAGMQLETGLICRRIEPFGEDFMEASGGICKRAIAHLMLGQQERDFWYQLPEQGMRRTEWLLGRIAAKDVLRQWAKQTFNLELAPVDIEILATELGKPMVYCPELEAIADLPDISITHSRGYIVAAMARSNMRLGVDIQRLDWVQSDDWLNIAFTPDELKLLPSGSDRTNQLALWCAKEAAAKAQGTGLGFQPSQWRIDRYSTDGKQVTVTHNGKSFEVQLWYLDREVLAICQHPL